MNRIILIGNGFDLNNGLFTDYTSFVDWYLRKALSSVEISEFNDANIFLPEKRSIYANNDKYPSSQKMISFYKETIESEGGEIKHGILSETIDSIVQYGWADIEAIYFRLLYESKDSIKNIQTINKSLQDVRKNLIEFLKVQENNVQLKKYFEYYLTSPIVKDDFSRKSLKKLRPSTPELFISGSNTKTPKTEKTLFLNFNYTTYWQKGLKKLFNDKTFPIINVHGELNQTKVNNGTVEDIGLNAPFFGYGDDTDNEYKELENIINKDDWAKYLKTVFYQSTENYKFILDFLEISHFEVVIAGHSCGKSDKTLLKTIFEHDNCVSIKPYFHIWTNKNGETNDNWLGLMANISRIFSDKARMRELVISRQDIQEIERPLTFQYL